uniref:Uncharacterized protein n=1 Tax=Leersia perrieri TaxID=77586 RepID=A0A0D9XPD9_9ORYZ
MCALPIHPPSKTNPTAQIPSPRPSSPPTLRRKPATAKGQKKPSSPNLLPSAGVPPPSPPPPPPAATSFPAPAQLLEKSRPRAFPLASCPRVGRRVKGAGAKGADAEVGGREAGAETEGISVGETRLVGEERNPGVDGDEGEIGRGTTAIRVDHWLLVGNRILLLAREGWGFRLQLQQPPPLAVKLLDPLYPPRDWLRIR